MKHCHLPPMKSHVALASRAFGIGMVSASPQQGLCPAATVATIALVFGSTRATLFMSSLETQTASGAMVIQSRAPGIEIFPITGAA
jgi:hypothetical protein